MHPPQTASALLRTSRDMEAMEALHDPKRDPNEKRAARLRMAVRTDFPQLTEEQVQDRLAREALEKAGNKVEAPPA